MIKNYSSTLESRYAAGLQALHGYARKQGTPVHGNEETLLIDILADLRHWAARYPDIDFDSCMRMAEEHYIVEREEEERNWL